MRNYGQNDRYGEILEFVKTKLQASEDALDQIAPLLKRVRNDR